MEAVNEASVSHGAHRILQTTCEEGDAGGDTTPLSAAEQLRHLSLSPRDCKEGPRSGSQTTGKGKGKASSRDSLGWYTSAESDDGVPQWGPELAIHVRVQPHVLGLSPTLNGGQAMLGEVTREFVHAVTGEDMCMVLFSTVVGHRAVAKKYCSLPETEGVGPSSPGKFGGTQQRLLQQFDSAGGDMIGLS